MRISGLRNYPELLRLGKERPDAIFLDFACCCERHVPAVLLYWVWELMAWLGIVGNDARKAIADGYPMQNVIASDIQPGMH